VKHLYGIDLLRFLAALMVCLFHIGFTAWANPDSGGRDIVNYAYPQLAWAGFGWVGVEIFFVISGFVIANSAGGRGVWGFVRSRALRLYPAVWVCAPITAALAIWLHLYPTPALINRFVRGVTLFPLYPWIEGVYWTLGVELVFYACVALLIWFRRFERIDLFAAALTLWSLLYNASGLHVGLQWSRISLLAHGCFFAVGIYFWMHTQGRRSWFLLPALAGCTIEILRHASYVAAQTNSAYSFVPLIVWALATAGIFLSWELRHRIPPLGGVLRRLGNITYPLYLIHFTAGVATCAALTGRLPGVWPVVAAIAAMVVLAFTISEWAEPWVRNRLRAVLEWGEARLGERR
jgi:exopolysaccharide production protein ExoZ